MDLAELTRDLEALRGGAAGRHRRVRRTSPALDALELDVLGKKGRLTGILRGIGALAGRGPPAGRCRRQRGPGRASRPRWPTRASAPPRVGARRSAGRRDASTSRRPAARSGAGRCTRSRDRSREIAEIFGQFGFVVYESPEIEDDLTQLPDAQHPARSPGARPVGHALRRRGRAPAAHPHVARPDPGHARRSSRRSGRCCRVAATATRRSTPATPRSSSRSRA